MAKQMSGLHESFRPCRDFIIAMVPLIGLAAYLYGPRVLILFGLSVATAFLCDLIAAVFSRNGMRVSDISSHMFAMIFTIMLPASSRYEIAVIGTAVTILLGKHAFGGYGNYPFHPSAFGFAFASVCWPETLYNYPASFSDIGLGLESGAKMYSAAASVLKHGGVPVIETRDLVLGNYPGPMGTTFCLIILSCLVLLIVHGAMTWHIPFMYLLTCSAWSVLFRRAPFGMAESLIYEMFSGAIIFGAVFIIAERTTAPVNPKAKILYGILLGAGTMLFRTFGAFEMGVCFSVLLVNPLTSYLDKKLAPRGYKIKGARI